MQSILQQLCQRVDNEPDFISKISSISLSAILKASVNSSSDKRWCLILIEGGNRWVDIDKSALSASAQARSAG